MRIIAGRYRRRKLRTRSGLVTRPITDRVKETLFSHIEPLVDEARIADVFSGTGTLGLESLSRGARSVVFIEQDRRAAELLRENVEMLGVQERVVCWQTSALRTSFRPKGVDRFFPYDVVFVDPPYRMIPGLLPGSPLFQSLQRLARPDVSSENSHLILRVPEHAEFVLPGLWAPQQALRLSNMRIHIYTKQQITDDSHEGDE
ncbi:MAG: 16S rRNA (guanine(966)-N(2))-methyltransferase RsmD [Planctomycetota bacterium]|nr:MAG: 16S rRNA (guanine(966)-N(2))-methyltransferase RsmD [Planctomycetota bacterium]REJ93495.1 MAG: 16S rRNA (guanine(966)-N(2))-methyltransferase RsmD [Planctomycetota bacterium]REK26147.1 MAG: 16S rRNA (guanine(966)-N(2))-methyltransferase RsmD [Planctomycetota bacterium]REK33516.1 MAG: 16S rRNA (guanine(966)-N(2))-methyltransferase RsmD [Planctomycetota bacterium]